MKKQRTYSDIWERRDTNHGKTREDRTRIARDAAPPFITKPAEVTPHSEFAGDAGRNGRGLSPTKRAGQRAK